MHGIGPFQGSDIRPTDGAEGVLLGAELARSIGAKQGDLITVVSPQLSKKQNQWSAQAGAPTSRPFRVRGIFRAGFQEYDARLAYMKLDVAQTFFGNNGSIVGLEVRVDDPMEAGAVAARLEAALGKKAYSILDWRRQNLVVLELCLCPPVRRRSAIDVWSIASLFEFYVLLHT